MTSQDKIYDMLSKIDLSIDKKNKYVINAPHDAVAILLKREGDINIKLYSPVDHIQFSQVDRILNDSGFIASAIDVYDPYIYHRLDSIKIFRTI